MLNKLLEMSVNQIYLGENKAFLETEVVKGELVELEMRFIIKLPIVI